MYHRLFEFLEFPFCFSRAGVSVSALPAQGFLGGSVAESPPANARGSVSVPSGPQGSGRSPGEGKGYPLQYSFLRNPMDRGVRWATVDRVIKEWDRT